MARPTMVIPATLSAVSEDELRAHRRDDDEASFDMLWLLAQAATRHIEHWTGRAIMTQGWQQVLDAFPAGLIRLPVGPVAGVDEIRYVTTAGAETILAPDQYRVDLAAFEARLEPVTAWPATAAQIGAVTIEWTAGADTCPDDLKAAVLMLAGHMFEHREAVVVGTTASELPLGVQALLQRHRRFLG